MFNAHVRHVSCKYNEQAFTTGTMGGLTPVVEVDGRVVGDGARGPVTEGLQQAYAGLAIRGTPIEALYPQGNAAHGKEMT